MLKPWSAAYGMQHQAATFVTLLPGRVHRHDFRCVCARDSRGMSLACPDSGFFCGGTSRANEKESRFIAMQPARRAPKLCQQHLMAYVVL